MNEADLQQEAAAPWTSLVAVPARLESSRLPNKVMADIGGQPMLRRVLECCRSSRRAAEVVLCTDSDLLRREADAWGFPVLMTAASCSSGSDRLASVVDALMAQAAVAVAGPGAAPLDPARTVIINVQGGSAVHRSGRDRCHG